MAPRLLSLLPLLPLLLLLPLVHAAAAAAAAAAPPLPVSTPSKSPLPSRPLVGMMYEGWHAPAYWGRSPTAGNLTVEGVIRSNGSSTLRDMAPGPKGMGFWWHKQPAQGFYCIYRKRASENSSSCGLPDCPGITQTLTSHAHTLVAAGVDFIVADSTNIQVRKRDKKTNPAPSYMQCV